MDCKDLNKDLNKECEEIRGGRRIGGNSISQHSANAGAYGDALVAGGAFNLSPVAIDSQVSQLNSTAQGAAISDVREHSLDIGIGFSQIEVGGWSRLWD